MPAGSGTKEWGARSFPDHPMEQYLLEDYEPKFQRLSTERRVLGHITDEVDVTALGPRNTLPALQYGLVRDDHTRITDPAEVQPHLAALVDAGLVSEADGVYTVTEDGWRELVN